MKMIVFPRCLLGVIALAAMANFATSSPVYARMPALRSNGAQSQAEYSPEELELLRAKLLSLVDAVKEMADLLPDGSKDAEKLEKTRKHFEQLSAKELAGLRKAIDPSTIDSERMSRARQTLADYKVSQLGIAQRISRARQNAANGALAPASAGFPVASPFCGPDRLGTEQILAADVIWFLADLIREEAQDACKQEVVVAGEGGNTSLVCAVADDIWVVAKSVNFGLHFCDDDFTGTIADTSYARLDHIHTDLENSVANDNANTTRIMNNSNSNTASIISSANSNTTTITTNDNANTATITAAIANAVATITGSSSSTQTQLRDLILHTQIEADLARDQGSVPVALYEVPASSGGLLDQVRAIVVQAITNVQAAGGTVGTAQSFLTQGDASKAAGQFKAAYDAYRKAYQMAAK